jgi:hypothetical protein
MGKTATPHSLATEMLISETKSRPRRRLDDGCEGIGTIAEIGKFLKSVSSDFESALTIKRSADFWFSSLAAKRIFLATAEYGTAE